MIQVYTKYYTILITEIVLTVRYAPLHELHVFNP